MRRRGMRRRGITLVETSVACALGTLLVYVVAMSWCGFTRGARLLVARAELVREADLAVARIAGSLRGAALPAVQPDGSLAIGGDVYTTVGQVLNCNGEPIAWHMAGLDLSGDARVVRLRMQVPGVYEDAQRTVMLRRDFYLMVAVP